MCLNYNIFTRKHFVTQLVRSVWLLCCIIYKHSLRVRYCQFMSLLGRETRKAPKMDFSKVGSGSGINPQQGCPACSSQGMNNWASPGCNMSNSNPAAFSQGEPSYTTNSQFNVQPSASYNYPPNYGKHPNASSNYNQNYNKNSSQFKGNSLGCTCDRHTFTGSQH